MGRPVTLFTGQFADIPLEEFAPMAASWGYDGLELACWGDHIDVDRAARDKKYAKTRREILADNGLDLHAISHHLAGQLVCDPNDDARSDAFAPPETHGDSEKKRRWAVKTLSILQSRTETRASRIFSPEVTLGSSFVSRISNVPSTVCLSLIQQNSGVSSNRTVP